MYRVFVLMLLQELDNGLAGTWAFVVRDIVYTLIRIMANNCSKYNATKLFTIQGIARGGHMNITVDIDLFTASCDLLFHVCKVALSICPQVCVFTNVNFLIFFSFFSLLVEHVNKFILCNTNWLFIFFDLYIDINFLCY